MKYRSTRGAAAPVTLSEALTRGLAEDGGLYVPGRFPVFSHEDFARVETLPEIGHILLAPFFRGDALEPELPAICADAFAFPIPLRPLPAQGAVSVLELFHGPTAAFKDVGARFLAACLQRLESAATAKPLTILVATSGDTGGAVAAAFDARPGIDVRVLYPAGLVSPRQEQQLTCWSDNVRAYRVAGAFDDCQKLVKQAFSSNKLSNLRLSSANSINVGRLLPQAVYYAAAALWQWRESGQVASFIIPSGNLGNAVAAVWARTMGLPIGDIVLATNANTVIPDFLHSGDWRPRRSVPTLASAMDVGDPSNMERLRDLHGGIDQLRRGVRAWAVSDDEIRQQIVTAYKKHGELWCPHTATGFAVRARYLDGDNHFVVVATAHPAKFETIIEPLIGDSVAVPPALARLLALPTRREDIGADFANFAACLLSA